jgi:hypothetical protein
MHNFTTSALAQETTASPLLCTSIMKMISLLHHKPCHHHWSFSRCHSNRRCPFPAAKPLNPRAHLLLLLLRRPLLLLLLLLLLLPCLLV